MTEIAIRLVFSLVVVIGLIAFLARYVARTRGGSKGAPIRVLHRQPVSRAASLTVVEVDGRTLLLGITEQNVSLVTELSGAAFADGSDDTLVEETAPAMAGTNAGSLDVSDDEFRALLRRERDQAEARTPVEAKPLAVVASQAVAVPTTGGKHRGTPKPEQDVRPASRSGLRPDRGGPLEGSVLSPAAWAAAASVFRGRKSA